MTDVPVTDNAKVEIAVMQEQIKGIREQQKAHAETTARSFDDQNKKMDSNFALIFSSLEKINTAMSRGNGVFVACLSFAGMIGAAITWAVTYVAGRH